MLILSLCKNLPTNETLRNNNSAVIKSFGENIDESGSIDLSNAVALMADADSMPMKLVGKVTEVCQAKGCWMNVVADNGQGEPIFVQFKDYGFFMPKDCAGKKVTMDGIVYRETTPVDELRHYAQDKGASAEEIAAITMPKEELKFMAKGVILHEK
ncbi:MAG: DUF4920 domain-containing protein [Saprospiraceae bacterium]|nr:DUF4920 domain-containing protein [Saprospiraceae bacterium]MBK6476948.1 DUF4920 domain-containing protein [Saprospiraceae bacterium]MBK6814754.1 DUF4920 domain-containing protein [Saprospiraceae bacterium]MBK7437848.1 DUF4920 domain-containing protein [Saprospiraceae bacterium]MBK7606956.1 DUF4920 domain-containing protein [Saprospiraceae bacterium]